MVLCLCLVLFGDVSASLRYSSFKVKSFGPVREGVWDCVFHCCGSMGKAQ